MLWFLSPMLALTGCAIDDAPLVVFAAASTREALTDALVGFDAVEVTASFAASSTLARQISAGAPADLFLSANTDWMDSLERDGLLADGSRAALLQGELSLIARAHPAYAGLKVALTPGAALPAISEGCVAMGDPTHVPAGLYARAALESLGWWGALAPRVLPAADVRAALALVQRGECPLGIVYSSDLNGGIAGVSTLGAFSAQLHPPVIYPVALTRDADPRAVALLRYLRGPDAADAFSSAGFTHLTEAAP